MVRDVYRVLIVAMVLPVLASSAMAVLLWRFAPQLAHVVTNAPQHGSVHANGTQTFTTYLRLFVPFLPLATLTAVLVAGARGLDAMWPAVVVQNTVVPSVRGVLLLVLVGGGVGTTAVGVAWSLPLVFGTVGCVMAVRSLSAKRRFVSHAGTEDGPQSWRNLSREFRGYAAPRGAGSAFSLIVLWLDVVLVGALASTRQAGIYAVASRYVILATFPMVALGFASPRRSPGCLPGHPCVKQATCTRPAPCGCSPCPGRHASSSPSSAHPHAPVRQRVRRRSDLADDSRRGHAGEHGRRKLRSRAVHDGTNSGQPHHRLSGRSH